MQQGGGQSMQQGPQQPCFKCKGNGYCHSSSMAHDKGPNERCFFCENCDGCGGSGHIQGQQTTVQQVGGMGGMGMGMGMNMGGPAVIQTSTSGLQPCFKCHGKGYCHDSDMDHDKGPDEKCFFCKDCDGCGGSGAIKGGNTTVQQVGMPGMMGVNMGGMGVNMNMGGMMGGPTVVETTSGPQPCFKCKGNGFCHESTMDHDKGENEKCFFCKDCDGCGGSGAIQGGTTTQTRF